MLAEAALPIVDQREPAIHAQMADMVEMAGTDIDGATDSGGGQ
jgi:hypothetical protein